MGTKWLKKIGLRPSHNLMLHTLTILGTYIGKQTRNLRYKGTHDTGCKETHRQFTGLHNTIML